LSKVGPVIVPPLSRLPRLFPPLGNSGTTAFVLGIMGLPCGLVPSPQGMVAPDKLRKEPADGTPAMKACCPPRERGVLGLLFHVREGIACGVHISSQSCFPLFFFPEPHNPSPGKSLRMISCRAVFSSALSFRSDTANFPRDWTLKS